VAELGMSAAHVSGSVERLRQKGLLDGKRATSDRRRQLWTLTPAGRSVLKAVLDDLGPWAKRLNERLSVDRREQLALILDELTQALSTGDRLPSPVREAANKTNQARTSRRAGPRVFACHEGDR
jgi:DNA-binding MarR family transcriptional regulator